MMFHRDLVRWLRTTYPTAANVRITQGGKHPRLTFTYQNQEHRVPIAGTPSDRRALSNQCRTLTRLLGAPEQTTTRQPRTLEELTMPLTQHTATNGHDRTPRVLPATQPQPTKPNSVEAQGYVVCHHSKSQKKLNFIIPKSLHKHLTSERMSVTQTEDMWELTSSAHGPKRCRYGANEMVLQVGAATLIKGYPKPFAKTPAEFILTDNTLLVRLTEAPRYRASSSVGTELIASMKEAEGKPTQVRETKVVVETTPDYATELPVLLNAIRRVENTTPYRLVKSKETGAWMFAAPIFR